LSRSTIIGSVRPADRAGSWRRPLGIACFVACALVVLYGVYLVIPYFHQ